MKQVLVADDTKNIRTLLSKCLQVDGYHTLEASDGKQALELLRAQPFHYAFLDIKMPLLSGTEVLKTIRAEGINTPVIIITAFATVKNAVECTQLGAVAYLLKPFTADKLRNVLSELKESNSLPSAARLIRSGHAAEALPILKKLLSEQPLNSCIYQLLASASEQMGKVGDAQKYKRIAMSIGTCDENKVKMDTD